MHAKTLYLLRHAKAEAGGKMTADEDRTLAPRGREACGDMGAIIRAKSYIPELALISPSARTTETVELVMQACGKTWKVKPVADLYLAPHETMLTILQQVDDKVSSLMIVGHNPGMHHAALDLSKHGDYPLRHELEMKYPTCALSVLRFAVSHWADIRSGAGELIDFITPGSE